MGNFSLNARHESYREFAGGLASTLDAVTSGRIKVRCINPDLTCLPDVDLVMEMDADTHPACLAVEVVRYGYPRDVQRTVWRLEEFRRAYDHDRQADLILLVAADGLSPGARELLRKRGIGYYERNGNLKLTWRDWLINIERPNLPSVRKEVTSLFTDSREAVVHALLVNRNAWLSVGELAALSQTSLYTASVVLQELGRREWCESSGVGRTRRRRICEPKKLMDAWAAHWTKRNDECASCHFFSERSDLLLTKLAERIESSNPALNWAFTGTAAANVYAPLLTSVDIAEIIVPPGEAENLARDMRLKPAGKGANVVLVERRGASLMFRDSTPEMASYFASPFIMYLDLLNGRGRNKELAENVLKRLKL